ncbi:hypothetical protein OPKNFCMD_0906 [Methylobacterium crusticola]|uniref:Uncharacterized protein n=1 Tax=Methylobacterium crusticola TaxID=1697972 RepID=A0ABQ4QTT8_9HYPH|nr:DUF6101 family protein [Methylobacterium crusticola]GJD48190.1 hypothetical protein OPKNFCMD_0906 [Methylobacterium crusticola]
MVTSFHSTNRQATSRSRDVLLPTLHRGPVQAEPSPLPVVGRLPGAAAAASLALCLDGDASDAAGEDRFAILVLDRSGDPLMPLGVHGDDEVVAIWRRLGAESGLPLVVIQEDGAVTAMGQQIGRVKLGAVRIRRRHGLLSGRRPRFLTRRKTARLPLRPAVYRGENLLTDGGGL